MPLDMAKDIIKQYADNREILKYTTEKYLLLSGGEPLLHPDFREIYGYASSSNLKIVILTNGTLIHKYIDIFNGDTIIQISLDGNREHHDWLRGRGTYDKAINSIKLLKEHGYRVIIKSVLHRYNKDDWRHILEIVSKYDIDGYSFNFYVKSRYNPDDTLSLPVNEVVRLMRAITLASILLGGSSIPYHWSKCHAGIYHISVTPDGRYIDCPITGKTLGRYPQKLDKILNYGAMASGTGVPPPCLPELYSFYREKGLLNIG